MDKSFNDQELSDIMKEIEALEEEFNTDQNGPDAVMEELAQMDEKVAIPQTNKKEAPVLAFKKPEAAKSATSSSSSMSFKVQGDLQLELQFEIGGKIVMLEVTETGLSIQMENGATFTVPVSDTHSVKKAV